MEKYGYGLNDAFWRTVWILDEETLWADGFTEAKFSKIKLGMTEQQVFEIMGEPLDRDKGCKEACFWIYTWHKRGNADFDQRWVVFNQFGKVSEIRKSFFID